VWQARRGGALFQPLLHSRCRYLPEPGERAQPDEAPERAVPVRLVPGEPGLAPERALRCVPQELVLQYHDAHRGRI